MSAVSERAWHALRSLAAASPTPLSSALLFDPLRFQSQTFLPHIGHFWQREASSAYWPALAGYGTDVGEVTFLEIYFLCRIEDRVLKIEDRVYVHIILSTLLRVRLLKVNSQRRNTGMFSANFISHRVDDQKRCQSLRYTKEGITGYTARTRGQTIPSVFTEEENTT